MPAKPKQRLNGSKKSKISASDGNKKTDVKNSLVKRIIEFKKPEGLFTLEYQINSSPEVLFEFISTASGLEKWFAKKVYVEEDIFTFTWEENEMQRAKLMIIKDDEYVRFHWLDEPEKRYFEFRIEVDDLTGEVGLIVSDFADTKEEYEESRMLWNSEIHDLQLVVGSS